MLFFVDNIFRFTLAGTGGVGAARPHAFRGGLPADAAAEEWAACRSASPRPRSRLDHLVQAVYVPADDLTDPSPATTFAHLDADRGVLSRDIAALGIYPAVDPLDSTSRQLDPNVVGEEHYNVARAVQARCSATSRCAGHHRHPGHGRALAGGQAGRVPRAQDPALPVAALPRRRGVHRHAGQVRAR